MRWFWALALVSLPTWGIEAFKVQIYDRLVRVEAPPKASGQYAVIIENLSLSDVAGKFVAAGKDLKFVSVKSTQSKTIEFTHGSGTLVSFQCMAPAFQEVALLFGKGAYEIPPKQ